MHAKIRDAYVHPQFTTDVVKPLNMDGIIDNEVQNLSGGELQRTAIVLCLGKPADIYLVDEPSAYLDSEQRLLCARVIKRFVMHAKKCGFIVEHDFIMATYLAFREARGIMTTPTNVTMDIVARFIMFCALQGMVFTFLPRVFPGV